MVTGRDRIETMIESGRFAMTIAANLHRTRFFFLHHGETDWDRDGKLAGRINAPLNGRGLAQARRAGEMLRSVGIRTICTSPQDRALMTAEIVAAQIHAPIITIEGLKDCCFGDHDGAEAGDWFAEWRLGVTPEGAESLQRFRRRGITAMNTALAHAGPVLVVAHPGIYAAFLEAAGMADVTEWPAEHAAEAKPIFHQPMRATRWHAETLAA
jgi:probable phosphoglycerate mutase